MDVKNLVVYFHGYGSSANSTKVDALRAGVKNSRVFSWDIDIDPRISLPQLMQKIDDCVLLHKLHEPSRVVFVGTSLGGWYASHLADLYGVDAVLINPAYNPVFELHEKYSVPFDVANQYSEISWSKNYKYLIAKEDDVIDFLPVADKLAEVNAEYVPNSSHRFNGPEFQKVIDYINSL
jgi:predicted esterase YcpF (UPF0227 family)